MPQFARPDADAHIGNFATQADSITNLFTVIDESTSDDLDYIKSPASPVAEVYVCGLSDIADPLLSTGHVMRMRTAVDLDAQEPIDFTQELRQGYVSEADQGTLIATNSRAGVTSSAFTTTSHTLSAAEANAITDYTDLFYRFVVNRP